MQKVEAIIRHFKLEEVKDAILRFKAGITVSQVRGLGNQRGHTEMYRGEPIAVDFLPKMHVTVLVEDDKANDVVNAIMNAARSGQVGDGKIWITEVREVVRIRTGETGDAALSRTPKP